MSPDLLSNWQTLLSMQAGAAATLTGLVFVAASINLTKIIATPLLTVRVVESLVQFLQVFFVCSVMIVPHQSSLVLAIEILVVSFISWAMQILGFVRSTAHAWAILIGSWGRPTRVNSCSDGCEPTARRHGTGRSCHPILKSAVEEIPDLCLAQGQDQICLDSD